VAIHFRVKDPDFDISASGEDTIAVANADIPPVKITISRASAEVTLGFAGGLTTNTTDTVVDVVGSNADLDDLTVAPFVHDGTAVALPSGTDPTSISLDQSKRLLQTLASLNLISLSDTLMDLQDQDVQ
jgi:hypothetical protein